MLHRTFANAPPNHFQNISTSKQHKLPLPRQPLHTLHTHAPHYTLHTTPHYTHTHIHTYTHRHTHTHTHHKSTQTHPSSLRNPHFQSHFQCTTYINTHTHTHTHTRTRTHTHTHHKSTQTHPTPFEIHFQTTSTPFPIPLPVYHVVP